MPTASEDLNQTARVVLGMVAEGHCTGYAIKAEIERSTRLFWGASVGGIYPMLKRLAADGLVSVHDDPRGETRRHRYQITADGRAALRAWLADDSEPVFEMRNESLLRLRFAAVLEPEERLNLLRRMRDLHEQRVRLLTEQLEAGEFDDVFHRLTAEYGLGINRWARDWATAAADELAAAAV